MLSWREFLIGGVTCLAVLLPAAAQAIAQGAPSGQTAESGVGKAGQRQTVEAVLGVDPGARITSRVANRVQSRIRNRIDRYYNLQANAALPFEIAGGRARTAGRPNQR